METKTTTSAPTPSPSKLPVPDFLPIAIFPSTRVASSRPATARESYRLSAVTTDLAVDARMRREGPAAEAEGSMNLLDIDAAMERDHYGRIVEQRMRSGAPPSGIGHVAASYALLLGASVKADFTPTTPSAASAAASPSPSRPPPLPPFLTPFYRAAPPPSLPTPASSAFT